MYSKKSLGPRMKPRGTAALAGDSSHLEPTEAIYY